MGKVRVNAFSISIDGYGAGVEQSLDDPLGKEAMALHHWFAETRTLKTMFGSEGGSEGIDNDFGAASMENLGAWIMGRNMFGPIRGEWPDEEWKGWWGDEPPYHCPVFVLTHHARAPLAMDGGTVFHFVTGGPEEALARAREAAGDKDIRIGGGVETLRTYFRMGAIDEAHIALTPVLLGKGENLFAGIDLPALGYTAQVVPGELTQHLILKRG